MPRVIVFVLTLVGLLIIPLVLKKCVAPKVPPVVSVPATPLPEAPASVPDGNRPMGYGLTFGLGPLEDNDPKDVANMVCDAGDAKLERPYKGSCNPTVGDTSCRIVLPVLCIKPGAMPRPGGLSGGGWTRGELAATHAVMGATLDSEAKANMVCERELGPGWRMATFADGGNYLDDQHYDHEDRGDTWALQGKLGAGIGGYGRYWVHSQGQTANCWNG
jgi:hypothetical protein